MDPSLIRTETFGVCTEIFGPGTGIFGFCADYLDLQRCAMQNDKTGTGNLDFVQKYLDLVQKIWTLYRKFGLGTEIFGLLAFGFWTSRLWTSPIWSFGFWLLDFGFWTFDF